MAHPVPPLHCVPDRQLSQPELERSNACLGAVVGERDRTIVGLQDYARDVSKMPPRDKKKNGGAPNAAPVS